MKPLEGKHGPKKASETTLETALTVRCDCRHSGKWQVCSAAHPRALRHPLHAARIFLVQGMPRKYLSSVSFKVAMVHIICRFIEGLGAPPLNSYLSFGLPVP